jgi:hypothetical protein
MDDIKMDLRGIRLVGMGRKGMNIGYWWETQKEIDH